MIELEKEKLSEEEVIQRVVAGEKLLYEIIIRRYNPYLYKVGRSYNYNHEDTEDLMQDTFVMAYQNLANFEGRSLFKTWLIRIMLNNCYHRQRKMSYKNEFSAEIRENSTPMFTGDSDDTGKVVGNNELKKVIETALTKIPYKYRMVFSLREINGLSTEETARLMEISASNVKVRLKRAKAKLRDIIVKAYSPKEIFEFNLIYCDGIVDKVMERINKL